MPMLGSLQGLQSLLSMSNRLGSQYQKQVKKANDANLGRYNELKGLLGGLVTGTDNLLMNQGNVGRQRVQANYQKALGAGNQDLISRGLGNTSALTGLQRGLMADREQQMLGIDEQTSLNRANMGIQTKNLLAGMIERRNDIPPDLSQYMSLLQLMSQGGQSQPRLQSPGYDFSRLRAR